jgi:hypothetical protein
MSDKFTDLNALERQSLLGLIKHGPRYLPDGLRVQLLGTYSVDDLIAIAIELETRASQTDATVAAFDYLMDATA